jgi:beta-glucosidase
MRGKAIERAMLAGKLVEADIDARVRKVFELLKHAYESGVPFDAPEESLDTSEMRQVLRTAAADSIVLLKNEKKLLPIKSNKDSRISVIGPNAKHAMTSGGGSARLLSTYTVSPLEGIRNAAKEAGADVTYSVGAYCHQFLPQIDALVKDAKMEFWNDRASEDFLSLAPTSQLGEPTWSVDVKSSYNFMMDNVVSRISRLMPS